MKKFIFSKKVVTQEKKINEETKEVLQEEEFYIEPSSYICKDEEMEMWNNFIKDNYGEYGEITTEDYIQPKTEKEIQSERIQGLEDLVAGIIGGAY